MELKEIKNYISLYPNQVVLFEWKQAAGAYNENAEVLRHTLYCDLFRQGGNLYASHGSLDKIELCLNEKNVSYVIVLQDGGVLKSVQYRNNNYLNLLNKYNPNWNKIEESKDVHFDPSEHVNIIKGHNQYGVAEDEADLLSRVHECDIAENSEGTIYAFDSLERIEEVFNKNSISYYVSIDNQIEKVVSYSNNRYSDFMPETDTFSEEPTEQIEEEIGFTSLTDDDVTEITSIRNIYFTHKFSRYYKKASRITKVKIDEILDTFKTLEEEELWDYLKRKNNKPLVGTIYNFDKLYVDNSSGHRLIWCRASDILLDGKDDEIVIIAYVDDHDAQGREGNAYDPNAELDLIFKEADNLERDAIGEFQKKIPPYLFYKNRLVPQLNKEQKSQVELDPPLLLQGCAGSGKTQVSLEIFKKLIKAGENPTYVTFTRELAEEVKEKMIHSPEFEDYDSSNSILTVEDFFLSVLKTNRTKTKILNNASFNHWKATRYLHKKDNKYKNLDSDLVWTYIRGIIKGRANSMEIIDRKAFSKLMENEGFEESESNLIYDIYEAYEQDIRAKGEVDDNDIAELVLEDGDVAGSVSTIIVDEVQDLTYLQIEALIHCAQDYRIYLCGDINQRINPTIIDLDAIRRLLYGKWNSALKVEHLGSSFRSGKGLVAFLNHLSSLRRTYIALQDQKVEVPETSIREDDDGLWATICNRETIDLNDVVKIAGEAANCIVIVPDEDVQDKLLSSNNGLENRVKTVQQMKGLEYENVIIYDFLSHKNEVFKEIFQCKRKRDTFGRLLFNLLYVACTRARDRLIICESDCDETIQELVYQDITKKDSIENVRGFMQLEVDDEGWLKEAQRLEQLNKYEMAKSAYQRIEQGDYSNDIKRCSLMAECYNIMDRADVDLDEIQLTLEVNADSLLAMEEYSCANKLYGYLRKYELFFLNGIYAMSMDDQMVPRDYVNRVIDEESEDKLEEEAHKMLPYTEERIRRNNKNIGSIKKILEEVSDGR